MMVQFSLCSVTEICSLSLTEGGSVHEVRVERESLSRAQGTRLGAWSLGTHLKKVEHHVSGISMPSVHAPSSHLTYLTKHRLKHKMRAFQDSSRASNTYRGSSPVGLCGVAALDHAPAKLPLADSRARDSSEHGFGDEAA